MTFYAQMNATADRLIQKYGVQYTFSRKTPTSFDPATGSATGSSTSTYNAYGVVSEFDFYEKQDASVSVEDLKMIAEVADFQQDDTVTISSKVYRVFRHMPIKPGDTEIAFILHLKK